MKTVLFVCKKNGGKSQMAAAVMRGLAGQDVQVLSAGTHPGSGLNAESVQALEARSYSVEGEYPKEASVERVAQADCIVVLGNEAQLEVPAGIRFERWDTVEPSLQGIEGAERMNLILDDIEERVRHLIASLD